MTALVEAAEGRAFSVVAAGPLEDFVKRFGTEAIEQIETRAAEDPKFRAALGCIWLRADSLPANVLERVVRASGGRIKPLDMRGA